MDKETICNLTLNVTDIDMQVIKDYCIEMGKELEMTDIFCSILPLQPILFRTYYFEALDYFQRKYNITIVRNKKDNIIKVF